MDDNELDQRIRRMLEVAQTDAPAARRWHPPAPRRSRTAGFLAAAAAVVVFGLMGFALVRGMAGSSSDDASSSATTAGGGSETTSAGSSAAETTSADTDGPDTTSGSATDSTAPVACASGEPAPGGFGTVVPTTLPIEGTLALDTDVTCPGRLIHLTLLVDNIAGTEQFRLVDTEVLLISAGGTRWTIGTLDQLSVAPGTSVTVEGDFAVPVVPEGTYTVAVRGLPTVTATLEIRAQLP